MTLIVDLTPDQEAQLQQNAEQRGLGIETILRELVDKTLSQIDMARPHSSPRIAGLHEGMIWVADDFDDPLPDAFWLGAQ